MGGALKILFPFCEGKDNCEKLPIINVIASLCRRKGLGEICTGMKVSRCVWLHENSAHCQKGGISHKGEGMRDIRDTEHGCGREDLAK